MFFRVQLWRGIFQPNIKFYQLRQAEDVAGFFTRLIILVIFSGLLSGLGVYAGLDTETFTRLIGKETTETIETMKFLFGVGSVLHGIIAPMVAMYLTSLFLWFLLKEAEFYQLMTIQLYVLFIGILEKSLWLAFRLVTGADLVSSPFGFGILAQLATDQPFLIHFMNSITIFDIWAIALQIIALKICTSLSLKKNSVVTITIYLVMNMIASLLSLIDIDQIFKVL
jgi:hypothetical protein